MKSGHGSRRDLSRLQPHGGLATAAAVLGTAIACFFLGVVFTSSGSGGSAPQRIRKIKCGLLYPCPPVPQNLNHLTDRHVPWTWSSRL